jgi:hypothetical protein
MSVHFKFLHLVLVVVGGDTDHGGGDTDHSGGDTDHGSWVVR